MTRQDYMNGKVTHHEFYLSVARAAGISFATSDLLPSIKAALEHGDEHLNSIHLPVWDSLALHNRAAIHRALKEHGDSFSLAGGVCTMKAAAKEAAK